MLCLCLCLSMYIHTSSRTRRRRRTLCFALFGFEKKRADGLDICLSIHAHRLEFILMKYSRCNRGGKGTRKRTAWGRGGERERKREREKRKKESARTLNQPIHLTAHTFITRIIRRRGKSSLIGLIYHHSIQSRGDHLSLSRIKWNLSLHRVIVDPDL